MAGGGETVSNHFFESLNAEAIMTIKANEQEAGFSLLELIVVTAIIGVLSTLAVPKYEKYKAKAAQTEVKAMLSAIHTAQELNLMEKGQYAANIRNDLGILISGDALYKYGPNPGDDTKTVYPSASNLQYRLIATAKNKLASCTRLTANANDRDTWCLNHDKFLSNAPVTGSSDWCGKPAHTKQGGCS